MLSCLSFEKLDISVQNMFHLKNNQGTTQVILQVVSQYTISMTCIPAPAQHCAGTGMGFRYSVCSNTMVCNIMVNCNTARSRKHNTTKLLIKMEYKLFYIITVSNRKLSWGILTFFTVCHTTNCIHNIWHVHKVLATPSPKAHDGPD
jgi:hypothetical protein